MGAIVGGGIATLLSLMVLSRAIVDNPFYRFAQYLLVGVALGYSAAVLVNQTLVPPINQVVLGQATLDTSITLGVSALLLLLLATRFGRQRVSFLANIPLAVLFGIGAAIALVGAIRGTLVPQLLDTIAVRRLQTADIASWIGTISLILAIVVTLLSFTYTQRGETPSRVGKPVRVLGRGLILVAFGVFLSSAVTTYIIALVTQLQAIADWFMLLANLF
jgi:multisubunit Na+/H+ antiporter MnhG subunit